MDPLVWKAALYEQQIVRINMLQICRSPMIHSTYLRSSFCTLWSQRKYFFLIHEPVSDLLCQKLVIPENESDQSQERPSRYEW